MLPTTLVVAFLISTHWRGFFILGGYHANDTYQEHGYVRIVGI